MHKIKFAMMLIAFIAFLMGCSSKEQLNPLGRSFGNINDTDPLKIGKNPTPPAKQTIPALVEGKDIVPAVPLDPPLIKTNTFKGNNAIKGPLPRLTSTGNFSESSVFENRGFPSDFVTIMNPNGAALTVWALAAGNWIWGYNLYNSKPFGDARVWQLIEFPNDMVMIKNAKTNTCLNAYGNGIVHYPCDQSNYAQFWKFFPMSNGSFQIQNFATQQCIQTPVKDVMHEFDFSFYNIYLTDCVKKGEKNLDRQWYITVPTFTAKTPYMGK
ncbi:MULTISPECIES: RICIN domain-containing protein [Campylobacter]|uniref:Cytolethal distending toxin subunit A n=1 Tax=Campylobacter lari TaxID=201 RepID=E5RM34_CAMLA|nr:MULTISPECIES: RICIN domain-containing protein [Campylobacter]MCR8676678.1 RICIN domain-containing protein [Campylobacter sp. S4:11]EAJ6150496.1 cytolethal distending toxin subunit A [Campylobacter lari]EAJ6151719.1 cytolethal distending toxin subunit A [Campylobacter lari]EHZ4885183.1 RICIN domain-containing protein [Campylobacter lari]EHZ4886229.1 RICIN domain-containing protein [Campylobacter lari]